MVQLHRAECPSLWAAVESIAPKIGCVPRILLEWVKRVELDTGVREGVTTSEARRVKDLEREVKAQFLKISGGCSPRSPSAIRLSTGQEVSAVAGAA